MYSKIEKTPVNSTQNESYKTPLVKTNQIGRKTPRLNNIFVTDYQAS